MEQFDFWIGTLVGSYLFVAMCVVMLGQPLRPVGHLLKATTFWYVVSWLGLGIALVMIRL